MTNYNFYMLLTFIFLIFTYCSDSKTDYESLAKVYVDLLVVEELYAARPDSLELKRQEIFKNYNINEQEYLNTLQAIPDEGTWDKFFNYANEYLLYLEKNVDLNR
ncbi:MAG: hypothetical protein JW866_00690 [Ignavibacteriales bacterium]|nr:hypothetical protein [Ignavibacteriales bacterium]